MLAAGNLSSAALHYQAALTLAPQQPVAHSNLGVVFTRLGQFQKAEAHFRRALEIKPDYVDALANLASLLNATKRFEAGARLALRALDLSPDHASALFCLATALFAQGDVHTTRMCFERAAAGAPYHPMIWRRLGELLLLEQKFAEAKACFEKALALDAKDVGAYTGLGIIAKAVGRWAEAGALLVRAITLNPRHLSGWLNLAGLLTLEGKTTAAKGALHTALGLKPKDGAIRLKLALTVPIIPRSNEDIDAQRSSMHEELQSFIAAPAPIRDPYLQVNQVNFHGGYYGRNEASLQREIAQAFLAACPRLAWRAPHCAKESSHNPRIRLGLITTFPEKHIVGQLFRGILENFSRARFAIVAFLSPRSTLISSASTEGADRTVALPSDLFAAQKIIAAERLDVLFYLDVLVDTFIYYLAFARLAPVQCTTWGHPVTTGIPNIDYFLSAEDWEPESAEQHYTETLVKLKRQPMYIRLPTAPTDVVDRAEFGLPKDKRIYLCAQSLFKIHPDFDRALGQILQLDPNGILVLPESKHSYLNDLLLDRLKASLAQHSSRVRLIPRTSPTAFLRLLTTADAVLDPFHWSGGNTTIEALACDQPVVTLPGEFMRGRLSLGFYKTMDLSELVVRDADEFAKVNVQIASDPALKRQLRDKVAARLSSVAEDLEAIKELETFLLAAARGQRHSKTHEA
jgi:protein O-GlcNAc transferase